ncbi:protein of unknown function [Sporobacter termitidis DSM 10068]|uniref:DUF370 domain-containing protein n=1 Tax=Sporobacter termitidis DSM 10068 TaxID=1123282 RepID=A0A1M5VUD4_9FIRM|nr:extracellular matrix/biofilm biosynthesis regulator RemA family protein [Sporobacter termitidis]SHH78790.1 protein of unknown function [Sporobacter termitidis DSM 10068]
MYLHLGQDVVVPIKSVLGIFDLDNTTGSQITRTFLKNAEKAGQIVNISDDLPKSFIVCSDDGQMKIYLSQLASSTLLKRSETMRFE